ncbi:Mitochondrial carnitine/acylcarnitine carrier protein [Chionoecetes opilio]|uniref:Mitochondrial carnitine/acylcarnitine carrier protein n=1 Tax=Chionoecetes opilio TaxID=41210 RepID=A0A8J4YJ97_CHIOP|nr:Mitochondrial carnitine/acylcarnitine carrier protein [Chionoecetes opilio]
MTYWFLCCRSDYKTQPTPAPGQTAQYSGTWDCALKTVRNEGFFGLYKGMAAPWWDFTPMFAVCFLGFGIGKKLQQKNPGSEAHCRSKLFNAGMLSGVFTPAIRDPGREGQVAYCRVNQYLYSFTLSLVQAASAGQKRFKGPIDVVKVLYKEGGIRSIYKGTCATLLRDLLQNTGHIHRSTSTIQKCQGLSSKS